MCLNQDTSARGPEQRPGYNAAMSWIRNLVYGVGLLVTAPIWIVRLATTGKWRTDWAGRFGGGPQLKPSDGRATLLIHAVSVGEVNATRELIDRLQARHEEQLRIVISTTTNTGTDRAKQLFGGAHEVVRYPLDLSGFVARFLRRVRPDAVALVELEVWPNFVAACRRRNIPVGVINGRLSERSFGRYKLIRPLIRDAFASLSWVSVQDESYRQRFV